jgi:dipeptidyl aminopeptidase/acylaminoacyl peptidase
VSWSADRTRIVVRVDGPSDGAVYQLVDMTTHQAQILGSVYKDITRIDVAPVSYTSYRAADGMVIPAYLTLPLGRPAKNLPLVVLPHGGPAASDGPEFDWLAQAFASRGYAVLQPQFRGSTGQGWNFLKAGFGEWGRKMQSDLSDGVRYLAGQGTIDPKRVCIVGASYGGYAALAGVTLEHGVYRCAVSVAGISDPMNMMSHHPGKGSNERYLERYFGVTGYNDSKLNEIAPLAHTDAVDIPILLIHGTHDSVVPYAQSQFIYDALKRDGKNVQLILLDSEDHWLSSGATRRLMLQETVKFLEANNPPG